MVTETEADESEDNEHDGAGDVNRELGIAFEHAFDIHIG
jgi:hypothetical protein